MSVIRGALCPRDHDRDHLTSRRGDRSRADLEVSAKNPLRTQFCRGSRRIPRLRRPVAIDSVRAGISGMYALSLAAENAVRRRPMRGAAGLTLVDFASTSTPTLSNVGPALVVSSRSREESAGCARGR